MAATETVALPIPIESFRFTRNDSVAMERPTRYAFIRRAKICLVKGKDGLEFRAIFLSAVRREIEFHVITKNSFECADKRVCIRLLASMR